VLAQTGDAIFNTETASHIALVTPANPDRPIGYSKMSCHASDSSTPNHSVTARKASSEQSSRQSQHVVVDLNSETSQPSSRRLSIVSPETPNRRPGSPFASSESSSPDLTKSVHSCSVRSSQSSSRRGATQSERVTVNLQSQETPNRRSGRLSAAASDFSTPNHMKSFPTRSSQSQSSSRRGSTQSEIVSVNLQSQETPNRRSGRLSAASSDFSTPIRTKSYPTRSSQSELSSRRGSTQSERVSVNLQSQETPKRRSRFDTGEFSNQLRTGSSQSLLPGRSLVKRHMFVSSHPNSEISKQCPRNSRATNKVSSPNATGTAGSLHRLSSKQSATHIQKVLLNLQSPVLPDRRVHASGLGNRLVAVNTSGITTNREETSMSGLCTQFTVDHKLNRTTCFVQFSLIVFVLTFLKIIVMFT
jgi:hypothetical protein